MPATRILIENPDWVAAFVDGDRPYPTDHDRVGLAIALARENVRRGTGGPFGAAVFERGSGRLVAVGVNRVVPLKNSSAHAEIVALGMAQARLGSFTLAAPGMPAHELAASCAPCAMCLGAVLWSGVTRLLYSATRDDAVGLGFDEGPVFPGSWRYLEGRGIEVVGGVRRDDGREVLELYRQKGGVIYNP